MPTGVYVRKKPLKKYLCLDCKKDISNSGKRCRSCASHLKMTPEFRKMLSEIHKANPYWLGKKMPESSRLKMSISRKGTRLGENHPGYKKDRNSLARKDERNDSAYRNWRNEVFKRDNYQCQIKNNDCNVKIVAHHILVWRDYQELRYKINNGITLCHAHHPRKRAEEKRLEPLFMEIVSVSKV